ncbi:15673_t:CDS:2, partial [Funneliformis geosporum]
MEFLRVIVSNAEEIANRNYKNIYNPFIMFKLDVDEGIKHLKPQSRTEDLKQHLTTQSETEDLMQNLTTQSGTEDLSKYLTSQSGTEPKNLSGEAEAHWLISQYRALITRSGGNQSEYTDDDIL